MAFTYDFAINYEDLLLTVRQSISNYKEMGLDVDDFEDRFCSIMAKVENKNEFSSNYKNNYADGIANLQILIMDLKEFDVYYKTYNACELIELRISDNNITKEELMNHVTDMINTIKKILLSKTMKYDKEKFVVDKIYETAYKLIKKEIIITGESQLYYFIKHNPINLSFFNKIILDELQEIKNEKIIKEKLFQIRKDGITCSYLNMDLIKRILIVKGDVEYKESAVKNTKEVLAKLKDNTDNIDSLLRDSDKAEAELDRCKKMHKRDIRNVATRFVSLSLAITSLILPKFIINALGKDKFTTGEYLKVEETYSSIAGDTTKSTETVYSKSEPKNSVIVKSYDEYSKPSRRSYQEYDVSYLNLDTPYDYYAYGEDNYGVVSEPHNTDKVSNYQDRYTEVTKTTYEYQGESFDENEYVTGTWGAYLGFLVVYLFISNAFMLEALGAEHTFLIGKVLLLWDELKDYYVPDLKKRNEQKRKVEKLVYEIMKLINENDKLRDTFSRLYEENKYLLDNPEELFKKFNSIDYSEKKEAALKKKKKYL